jgi:hypothetical protein
MNRIFNYLYRHTFLSRILYRRTIAYRKLFPDGQFLDPRTPYRDEIKLIRKAIKNPMFDLDEADMGIVLSQLIQSDTSSDEAWEICATVNSAYADKWHYAIRRNIVEQELSEAIIRLQEAGGNFLSS